MHQSRRYGSHTSPNRLTRPSRRGCASAFPRSGQRARPGRRQHDMTAATVPGIDDAPTTNTRLLSWVREVAELTTPDRIVWCDGSDEEWERVTDRLVEAGTFICSLLESDAGVTNNWCDPVEMKAVMTELYRGCMRGRTMYVVPFCMGPTTAEKPM